MSHFRINYVDFFRLLQKRERQRHKLEGRVGVSVIDGEITGGKSPHEWPREAKYQL